VARPPATSAIYGEIVSEKMSMERNPAEEAARVEGIWSGDFGNEYVGRNPVNPALRQEFWRGVTTRFPARSILEVGCNLGANLRPLSAVTSGVSLAGIDINSTALAHLHASAPAVKLSRASARALPFGDRSFDLVFTCGVLIHQPPEVLPLAMAEIVRCSRRYVLCAEYYAPHETEVPYRGQTRALFKADFGAIYASRFALRIVDTERLIGPGWDDVMYWMLEKGESAG